jgi:ABC-type sugar transport system permease subunit
MIYESFTLTFQLAVNKVGGGQELSWIGFENYKDAFFTDTGFVQTLLTGLQNLALEIPAILIFSLFMAIMLNQKMVGRAAFRAIFFVPVILSTGIMESIASVDNLSDSMMGGIDSGAGSGGSAVEGAGGAAGAAGGGLISAMDIEGLFAGMKIGTGLVETIVGLINSIYDIVNRSGVQMLIFLAALQSISPAIYESCKIDGATAWETFWKITFPMVSPMILVNGVYTIIDSFTTDSNVVMKYIEKIYATAGGDVISSAMSWIYFLVVIAILGLIAAVCSAYVFYQKKN